MKIINFGKINTKVKCSYCDCEYEFDGYDVKYEYGIPYEAINCACNPNMTYKKYVECPMCKERKYIDDLIKENKEEEQC